MTEAEKVMAINNLDAAVEHIVVRIGVQLYTIPERELRGVVCNSQLVAQRIRDRVIGLLGGSLMRIVREETKGNEDAENG